MNTNEKNWFMISRVCKVIFVFISLSFWQNGCCQKFLTLQKNSFKNRIVYRIGDEITIKVDDNKFGISGLIYGFGDSSINFNGQSIGIERITQVMNYKKRAFHRAMVKQAQYSIPPILVFDAGNRLINTGQRPIISKEGLRISSFFATIGLAFLPYRVKRYNVTTKWRLRVVDVTP